MRAHTKTAGVHSSGDPDIAAGVDYAGLRSAAVCVAGRLLVAAEDGRVVLRAGVLRAGGAWAYALHWRDRRRSPAMRCFADARDAYAAPLACQLLKVRLPQQARAAALRGDSLTAETFAFAELAHNPRKACAGVRYSVYDHLRERAHQLQYIAGVIERRKVLSGAEIIALLQHVRAMSNGPPKKKKPRGVLASRG